MSTQNAQPPAPPATTPSTGGGGGDQRPDFVLVSTPEGVVKVWKRRKPMIQDEDFSFSPKSLVGSWFHRLENDAIVWQGAVIAEPQPGTYLLQIDTLDVGAKQVQRLMPLATLVCDEDGYDWRFYDTEDDARSAYAAWVATERERA